MLGPSLSMQKNESVAHMHLLQNPRAYFSQQHQQTLSLISGSHQRRMPGFKSASKAPSFLFTFPKILQSPT